MLTKTIERFGPEWWGLYAVAWQARQLEANLAWSPACSSNPAGIAALAIQDADNGIDAFNRVIIRMTA